MKPVTVQDIIDYHDWLAEFERQIVDDYAIWPYLLGHEHLRLIGVPPPYAWSQPLNLVVLNFHQ